MAGSVTIGVLALQGDVREHAAALERIGVGTIAVRRREQLANVDGLIIPGGESTVIDKLSRIFALSSAITAAIGAGLPVLGTCAGLIMLADRIHGAATGQQTFGGLDITVERNAYGSQVFSSEITVQAPRVSDTPIRVALIRGPRIVSVGSRAQVLARTLEGHVVAVEQGPLIGMSFHPEITGEDRFHRYFAEKVHARKAR